MYLTATEGFIALPKAASTISRDKQTRCSHLIFFCDDKEGREGPPGIISSSKNVNVTPEKSLEVLLSLTRYIFSMAKLRNVGGWIIPVIFREFIVMLRVGVTHAANRHLPYSFIFAIQEEACVSLCQNVRINCSHRRHFLSWINHRSLTLSLEKFILLFKFIHLFYCVHRNVKKQFLFIEKIWLFSLFFKYYIILFSSYFC